jgi:hypothetical protein
VVGMAHRPTFIVAIICAALLLGGCTGDSGSLAGTSAPSSTSFTKNVCDHMHLAYDGVQLIATAEKPVSPVILDRISSGLRGISQSLHEDADNFRRAADEEHATAIDGMGWRSRPWPTVSTPGGTARWRRASISSSRLTRACLESSA